MTINRDRVKRTQTIKSTLFACLLVFGSLASVASNPLQQRASATTKGGVWEQISAGGDFNCALSNGAVYCRGVNDKGQLGNGTLKNSFEFSKVGGLLAGKSVTQIVTGGYYACALARGEAYCWGDNESGQLGDGTNVQSSVPVKVKQTADGLADKQVTHIAAAWAHVCVVAEGKAFCWGRNSSGQLGDNTTTNNNEPVKVTQDSGVLEGQSVTTIDTGGNLTCALTNDKLYCWGSNYTGQLGNGTTTQSSKPVAVDMTGHLAGKTVTAVSVGWDHVCAIASAKAYCWGSNYDGQQGNGSTNSSFVPTAVQGDLTNAAVETISIGDGYSCAIASNEMYCWGSNYNGNLGIGTTDSVAVPTRVTFPNAPVAADVQNISASDWNWGVHVCAIVTGQIYCWGHNEAGAIGSESQGFYHSPNPLTLRDDSQSMLVNKTISQISSNSDTNCTLADGEVYCWGNNGYGQLSDGTATNRHIPIKVQGLLAGKTVTSMSVGAYHICAIASSEVYCWGLNNTGQLGDGTTTSSLAPIKVQGVLTGKAVASISAGASGTCALSEGEAYCWGANYKGQLGDGTTVNNPEPVKVQGLPVGVSVESIDIGQAHACAVLNSELYCWGDNSYGQLGDGTSTDNTAPVKVQGLLAGKTVESISVGDYHTCTIASNEAYCLGNNSSGQLGNGTIIDSSVPVKIAGLLTNKTVNNISAGQFHTCALAVSETYCWGSGSSGKLGDGTRDDSYVPIKVQGVLAERSVTRIDAGGSHSCALSSGTIYCWGSNGSSQLGYPPQVLAMTPVLTSHTFSSLSGVNGTGLSETTRTTIAKRPTFSGTAQPGATVVVTVRSDPVTCTATADSNGNWSCALPADLPAGNHTVTVVVTQTDGTTDTLGPFDVQVNGTSTTIVTGTTGTPGVPNTGYERNDNRHVIALWCALTVMLGVVGTGVYHLRRRI